MQTFLPYADFAESARVLDPRRLGKQRVEALQVVRAITWPTYGWRHHPIVRMWRGYEEALGAYGVTVCHEWIARGHADTVEAKLRDDLAAAGVTTVRSQAELTRLGRVPPWLGDERVHGAIARPCSARTRTGTAGSFPTCRPTCRTDGTKTSARPAAMHG